MDYIKLKKTLLAVFDHFLSCHDMDDLEIMMQAFEAGKKLSIQLPEKINRADYKDDLQFMRVSKPKTIRSRIRKTKPKHTNEISAQEKHICDIPILMNLTEITDEKKALIANILKFQKHKIIFKNYDASDSHGFATARIYHIVKEEKYTSQKQTHCKQAAQENLLEHSPDKFPANEEVIPFKGVGSDNETYYNDCDHSDFGNQNIFKADTSFKDMMHQTKKAKSQSLFREMIIQEVKNRIKKQKDPP